MRKKSHQQIGRYLVTHYLESVPVLCQKAFLFGCVEPDHNPATYLKGSFRCQYLRGHNFRNARRFMETISKRLERKVHLNLYDYYTLGKLIHYTADAFTYPHNDFCPLGLVEHKKYEVVLQEYFLAFLQRNPAVPLIQFSSIMEAISSYHSEYASHDASVHTDSRFALDACCSILAILFPSPSLTDIQSRPPA